jgi:flavin reductase (DIM6/NTAB) family NADH-FMN oxidoreductase RutF
VNYRQAPVCYTLISSENTLDSKQEYPIMCKLLHPTKDAEHYRSALGQFTTGVAIVTSCNQQGKPVGMTINSFNSVSLVPRLVSWCIDMGAASYNDFRLCREFTISILTEDQQAVAKRFASRGVDKFEGVDYQPHKPFIIPSASAWFTCENHQQFLLGDHLMLIGQVIEFGHETEKPLLFAQGKFHRLLDQAA